MNQQANSQTTDQQTQLTNLLAQMQQAGNMAMQPPTIMNPLAGVIAGAAIPIKLDTPMGSVRVYISVPAEVR